MAHFCMECTYVRTGSLTCKHNNITYSCKLVEALVNNFTTCQNKPYQILGYIQSRTEFMGYFTKFTCWFRTNKRTGLRATKCVEFRAEPIGVLQMRFQNAGHVLLVNYLFFERCPVLTVLLLWLLM